MENLWNRQVKRLMVTLLAIFFTGLLICNIMQNRYRNQMRIEDNHKFAFFLGNVKALCPQLKEEEWIQLLNGEEHYEEGRRIMNAYGILENDKTFNARERELGLLLLCSNLGMITVGLGWMIVVVLYLRRRQKNINALTRYMLQLQQGDYSLDFYNNQEDDLSSLKNELYKITVMLKEQAAAAKQQKAALAESVSDISHQLKTPLTSVMVLVDNLAESNDMPEHIRKHFLAEITRQLTGVSWLIAALLKLSKLEAGVVEFEWKQVGLKSLLEETLKNLEMMAEWKQVELSLDGEGKGTVYGDSHWLKEAFTNIVKNGIEHSKEHGKIELRIQDNSVYTQVLIRDYGEGMTQEEQKHIFERFYQRKGGKGSTGRKSYYGLTENTGIGLALAKEIIEKQKGSITVESGPDEGTCFFVKFYKMIG
ncbi:MAG: HAMP domain-containing histidine kinase [Roseburia sp.]|nr:HAMP domain-containing histidine kinase [Roseburia sp.]